MKCVQIAGYERCRFLVKTRQRYDIETTISAFVITERNMDVERKHRQLRIKSEELPIV